MSEWWTYHLSDFLLFSPRTYYRLFEIYNAAIWPAQIVALGLGVGILALVRRGSAGGSRAIPAILAASWLWVAYAFHARRYATINTAAVHFAWAFGIESALLLWIGVVRRGLTFERPDDRAGRIGLWMFVFALLLEPVGGPLLGRGWKGIELFGVAPDPTAVATLGLLLLGRGRRRWPLMIIPALWCVTTGFTLLAMKAPDFWVAPAAAVVALVVAAWRWIRPDRGSGAPGPPEGHKR